MNSTSSSKKIVKKEKIYLKYLDFNHRRLSDKAKEYRHEVSHLTSDLQHINQKIQRQVALCRYIIDTLSKVNKTYRLSKQYFTDFDTLLYHMENFVLRLYAYKEKLSLFINFSFDLGYLESDRGLYDRLIKNKKVNKNLITTELKKLNQEVFKKLFKRRKLMTHLVYYKPESYIHLLYPNLSIKKEGLKKVTMEWRKQIIKETEYIDICLVKIFEINKKITNKTIEYLNRN
jgi:hypothetical protein